jgi:hypothetical protein
VQPVHHHSDQAEAPSIVHEVLRSPGQPLDPDTRAFMEPRFGWDFSKVRVHTDSLAADSAKEVKARAYTVGHDVVFAANQFSMATAEGKTLLAHELTHVVQQPNASTIQRNEEKTPPRTEDTPCERASLKHSATIPYEAAPYSVTPCIWTMFKNLGPCTVRIYPVKVDTPQLKANAEPVKISPGEAKDVAAPKGCLRFEVYVDSDCDQLTATIKWGPPCAM